MTRSSRPAIFVALFLVLVALLVPRAALAAERPSPERNGDEGGYVNSFRFVDGIYDGSSRVRSTAGEAGAGTNEEATDGEIDTEKDDEKLDFREGTNTWVKLDDGTYRAIASDGSIRMEVKGATALGIDVSIWQGEIDWKAVKDSGIVDYAIIRCGWGANVESQDDAQFLNNVRGCQENDIPFGVYLHTYACDAKEAVEEAEHVLRLLDEAGLTPEDLDYPIYFDMETQDPKTQKPAGQDGEGNYVALSNLELEQIATAFCDAIEEAGYEPGIYANLNWWLSYLQGDVYDSWNRWVAQYSTTCDYAGAYDMWQCMNNGRFPGIDANVDVNLSFDRASTGTDGEKPATQEMHRLYNAWTGEHFYTADDAERASLEKVGWSYEGVGWTAPTKGDEVYRLYNPYVQGGDHHYTMDEDEYEALRGYGWRQEGIGWHSADEKSGEPLWRQYNPYAKTGTHNYTADKNEKDTLLALGWHDEGIAWYGVA